MENKQMEQLKENLKKANSMRDWYATCPICHTKVLGTLADIMNHRCNNGK